MFGFFKKKELDFKTDFKSEPEMTERDLRDPPEYTTSRIGSIPVVRTKDEELYNTPFGSTNQSNELNPLDEFDIDHLQKECEHAEKEKKAELETHIGKLVISINNKIENPTVAVGVEVLNSEGDFQHKLFAYDIVKKEQIELSGIIFDYTEQKFDALNKMLPNDRIALFFNRLGNEVIDKKEVSASQLFPCQQWKTKVLEAIQKINRGEWT